MVVHKCPFDIWDNWVSMISSSSELPCLLCDTPAVLLSVKEKESSECQQCLPLLFDYWDKQGTHTFGEYCIKYVFWIIKGGKGVICADWKHLLSLLLICSIGDENQSLANAKKALWAISIAPNIFLKEIFYYIIFIYFSLYLFTYYLCVCLCVCECVSVCLHVSVFMCHGICGGQRVTFWSWSFLSSCRFWGLNSGH